MKIIGARFQLSKSSPMPSLHPTPVFLFTNSPPPALRAFFSLLADQAGGSGSSSSSQESRRPRLWQQRPSPCTHTDLDIPRENQRINEIFVGFTPTVSCLQSTDLLLTLFAHIMNLCRKNELWCNTESSHGQGHAVSFTLSFYGDRNARLWCSRMCTVLHWVASSFVVCVYNRQGVRLYPGSYVITCHVCSTSDTTRYASTLCNITTVPP